MTIQCLVFCFSVAGVWIFDPLSFRLYTCIHHNRPVTGVYGPRIVGFRIRRD